MKVIAQLLKEFWLPLILGVVWTLFNVLDKPPNSWSVKDTLNIFGPTFFFMSWPIAQWYRVKKQQKVEEGLGSIQSDIRALHLPLLPCAVFYTLKHKCRDDTVKFAFSKHDGYKKYNSDSILKPIGLVHLNSAYNAIEQKIEHSRCSIKDTEAIREIVKSGSSAVWTPNKVSIEFFFGGKKEETDASLIVKKSNGSSSEVLNLELFDNTVYRDVGLGNLLSRNLSDKIWSITDLQGAILRITLEFGFFHLPGETPKTEDYWPSLHNFQLILGEKSNRVLSFGLNDLSKQIVCKNPTPLMKGDFTSVLVKFEHTIDKVFYSNQIFIIG